jgi:MFS family permease
LAGQLADIFGRRRLLLVSIALFLLGSGLCGGATTIDMLIAGRTVQGVGGAGIYLLTELIVCDMVPLSERAKYLAIIYSTSIVGSAMGPWIGGEVVEMVSWRWVFYINLPIGGTALLLAVFCLKVNHLSIPLSEAVRRIDYAGNVLFVVAVASIMFGLIYGGARYAWGSWHIVVPLVLGFVGVVVFALYEASSYCPRPALPRQIFASRTSLAALVISVLHSSLLVWVPYFAAVYFQSVLRATPAQSGVNTLPIVLGFVPAAGVAGSLLTKFGGYRAAQYVGLTFMTICIGLLSLLKEATATAGWVLMLLFFSVGCGIVMPVLIPLLQAELSDEESAAAMAAMTICRNFGSVWGTIVPAAVFNNQFDRFADRIQDAGTRHELLGGQAYAHATEIFIESLHQPTQAQVISTFVQALKPVWYVGIAICIIALLCVLLEKKVVLRTTLDTKYGITDKPQNDEACPDPEAWSVADRLAAD